MPLYAEPIQNVTVMAADTFPLDIFSPLVEGRWYWIVAELLENFDVSTLATIQKTGAGDPVGIIYLSGATSSLPPNTTFTPISEMQVAGDGDPQTPGMFYVNSGQGPVQLSFNPVAGGDIFGQVKLRLFDYPPLT